MLLFIVLTIAAFIGIVYGIVKKNKTSVVVSVVSLVVIVIILLVYSYLYSLNPY
jgi:hypothetical protein